MSHTENTCPHCKSSKIHQLTPEQKKHLEANWKCLKCRQMWMFDGSVRFMRQLAKPKQPPRVAQFSPEGDHGKTLLKDLEVTRMWLRKKQPAAPPPPVFDGGEQISKSLPQVEPKEKSTPEADAAS